MDLFIYVFIYLLQWGPVKMSQAANTGDHAQ